MKTRYGIKCSGINYAKHMEESWKKKNISHLKRLEGLNTNFGSFMGAFERRSGVPGGHRWNELPGCRPSNG